MGGLPSSSRGGPSACANRKSTAQNLLEKVPELACSPKYPSRCLFADGLLMFRLIISSGFMSQGALTAVTVCQKKRIIPRTKPNPSKLAAQKRAGTGTKKTAFCTMLVLELPFEVICWSSTHVYNHSIDQQISPGQEQERSRMTTLFAIAPEYRFRSKQRRFPIVEANNPGVTWTPLEQRSR
jgi:hypothetical protein